MVVSAQRPSKTQERGLRIDYIGIIKDMYGFYSINWESNGEEEGIAWWFMRVRVLYLSSAGDEGMKASIVIIWYTNRFWRDTWATPDQQS